MDANTAATIAVCGAILGPVILSWLNGRQNAKKQEANWKREDEVAERLAEINKANSEKLDGLVKVTDVTHSLVNSAMGVQLKISAIALRRVSELSGNADDAKAAELAESARIAHEANQRKLDSKLFKNP